MCPLGIKAFPISIKKFNPKNRKEIWNNIIEQVAFKYDFTGSYTNINEYISLDSIIIKESIYKEIYLQVINFAKF